MSTAHEVSGRKFLILLPKIGSGALADGEAARAVVASKGLALNARWGVHTLAGPVYYSAEVQAAASDHPGRELRALGVLGLAGSSCQALPGPARPSEDAGA